MLVMLDISWVFLELLFVYIWHGVFVKIAIYFGLIQALSHVSNTLVLLVILLISAILITALLSSAFVANLTNRFLFVLTQKLLLIKN
jgi:ABC-type multidrug transport system permease subunit